LVVAVANADDGLLATGAGLVLTMRLAARSTALRVVQAGEHAQGTVLRPARPRCRARAHHAPGRPVDGPPRGAGGRPGPRDRGAPLVTAPRVATLGRPGPTWPRAAPPPAATRLVPASRRSSL